MGQNDQESIVDEAMRIVRGNREGVYGPPDQNFRTIAAMWSSWLSVRLKATVQLDPADVCFLMQLMKLARLANSPGHRDSLVDIVGYADCADVCQQAAKDRDARDAAIKWNITGVRGT